MISEEVIMSNKYSKVSADRLATAHRDLQTIFTVVLAKYDHSILCGFRSQSEQDEAFNAGNSSLKWPNSKHNKLPSMAIDAAPYFKELGNIDWKDIPAICYFAGKVKATADELLDLKLIEHKLAWGGDWDEDNRTSDHKLQDYVHFELRKN